MSSYQGFRQEVDQSLINQAQTGDMAALEAIYNVYCDACYSLALRISGQQSTAQDILQDVFIKVIKNISSYRAEGNFAGWLRQIVARESINHINKVKRINSVDLRETTINENANSFSSHWIDISRDLKKLTAELSSTARAVLFLHELEGYTHAEIAKMFNKSESFSKVTLKRAYSTLKDIATTREN